MKFELFFSILLAILLSMVVSKVVYYGFTPNEEADVFSKKAFKARFDHDVYQYRILSKYLLFQIDKQLGRDGVPEWLGDGRLAVNTVDPSVKFYMAICDLNTAFLVLTCIMVALLLYLPGGFHFSMGEKNLILFIVPVLIGLSEFTVSCCDVSSYFFQLLILYVFLRWSVRQFWFATGVVVVLVILSTLNQESSILSVAIITLLLWTQFGIRRRTAIAFSLIAAAYLLTYAGLHVLIQDPSHKQVFRFAVGKIFFDYNFIGLLFWCVFFCLPWSMADQRENKYLIIGFYLFSLLYIYNCFFNGTLWEIRLFVPLLLCSLFLSKLDTSSQVVRLSTLTMRRLRRKLK